MKVWRYQVREETEITAPVEQVYAIAADPESVPVYAPEVARIDLLKRLDENTALVRSHLKFARLTLAFVYRYHYRAPTHYSGVQESGRLLRGYFSFSFRTQGDGTVVSHTEGVQSSIPYLAKIVGFIYFQILSGGGVREELARLKELVETRLSPADSSLDCETALKSSSETKSETVKH